MLIQSLYHHFWEETYYLPFPLWRRSYLWKPHLETELKFAFQKCLPLFQHPIQHKPNSYATNNCQKFWGRFLCFLFPSLATLKSSHKRLLHLGCFALDTCQLIFNFKFFTEMNFCGLNIIEEDRTIRPFWTFHAHHYYFLSVATSHCGLVTFATPIWPFLQYSIARPSIPPSCSCPIYIFLY